MGPNCGCRNRHRGNMNRLFACLREQCEQQLLPCVKRNPPSRGTFFFSTLTDCLNTLWSCWIPSQGLHQLGIMDTDLTLKPQTNEMQGCPRYCGPSISEKCVEYKSMVKMVKNATVTLRGTSPRTCSWRHTSVTVRMVRRSTSRERAFLGESELTLGTKMLTKRCVVWRVPPLFCGCSSHFGGPDLKKDRP